MAEIKLPWEDSEEVIEYEYVNPRKAFSEKYAYVITFILLILGIIKGFILSIILALLLLLSLVTKTYVAVTSKGLEMFTDMKFTKTHNIWDWASIETITYEKKHEHPKLTLLYFTKGDVTKRFFFNDKDRDDVFELAHKYNNKIKIYDAYKFKESMKRTKDKVIKSK